VILKQVAIHAVDAPRRDELRTMMESWSPAKRKTFEAEAERRRDEAWKALGPLRQELSPWEHQLLQTTSVTMTERQQVDASWRIESFQVMIWALGLLATLPPYDAQVVRDITSGFPPSKLETFLAAAALRPAKAIERERSTAELWHWRSRTRELVEKNHPVPADIQAQGLKTFDGGPQRRHDRLRPRQRLRRLRQGLPEPHGGGMVDRELRHH
jgi:hypothetical protein